MDKYVMILDTETTNSLDDPLAYDIGFGVINTETGEAVETHSYVVADIFLDKELMSYAYFKEKIPQYWEDIQAGKRKLRRLKTIRFILHDVCKQYNIKIICAHNMRFDNRSCNLSQRYLTSSKYRYFFPYGVVLWDSLKMAREIFSQDENYGEFCYDNDYLTKRGQRRYTAEILYRFLSGDNSFEEAHCGLEDVLIEKEIFMECLRRMPNIDGALWG